MRIPDNLLAYNMSKYLSTASDRMSRLQVEVASGIRIHRPSDDPSGAVRASTLRTGLTQVDQYQKAVKDANTWLKSEDGALGNLEDLVRQARNVALQGSNPQSADARNALKGQVEMITKVIVQSGNNTNGAQSLFAGFQTMSTPYSQDAVTGVVSYSGDNGTKVITVSDGITLTLSHSGAEVFNSDFAGMADSRPDTSIPSLFETLSSLATAIGAGDADAIQDSIKEIDTHSARIISLRAETGIRLQQVELADDRLGQTNLLLNDLLVNTENTDLTTALVELKQQENVFQAATYISSTLGRGGLLQWLR